jgi:hypothetical protein
MSVVKAEAAADGQDLDDAEAVLEGSDVKGENKDENGEEEPEEAELEENEFADINMELLRALGIVGSNFKSTAKKPQAVARRKKKPKVEQDPATLRRTPRAVPQRCLSDMSLR